MRNYCMWVIVCVAVALLVYDVKYSVQDMHQETQRLKAELIRERERVHMLELEWTQATRPERIRALAEQYTSLIPITTSHIQTASDNQLWQPASNDSISEQR